jgi:hypothetical protein
MDIVKDSRLISLDSNFAIKLNGDYNSNLFFHLEESVEESPNIKYIEVALEDMTLPVSWYLINADTNTLNFTYNSQSYTMLLKHGNYNATTLIDEMTTLFNTFSLTATITFQQNNR